MTACHLLPATLSDGILVIALTDFTSAILSPLPCHFDRPTSHDLYRCPTNQIFSQPTKDAQPTKTLANQSSSQPNFLTEPIPTNQISNQPKPTNQLKSKSHTHASNFPFLRLIGLWIIMRYWIDVCIVVVMFEESEML